MQRKAPAVLRHGRKAVKADTAQAGAPGKQCWRSATLRCGPYPAHEDQGRTWFDDCPEQSDGARLRPPVRIGGLFSRARLFLWNPHQQPTHPGYTILDNRTLFRHSTRRGAAPPPGLRHQQERRAQRSGDPPRENSKSPINRTTKTGRTLDSIEQMC